MKISTTLISALVLSLGLSSVAFAKKKRETASDRCMVIGGFWMNGSCFGDWESNDNVIVRSAKAEPKTETKDSGKK